MIEFAGSFTGRVRVLSILALLDVPNHELQTAQVAGPQTPTDEKWNGARVTYWAVTDLVAGNGTQRGYYLNERADRSCDRER
jgi:hypothetical protein